MAGETVSSTYDFYEAFHRETSAPQALLDERHLTYGNCIAFLRRHLPPGGEVIEIGCGNGVLSLYAATLGCRVVGLDISSTAVEAATTGAARLGVRHVRFVAADFERFTPADQVDAIFSFGVLEHLQDDHRAVARMVDLLRPGGKLLLRVPTASALLHRARMALFGRDRFDESVGHLRRYSEEGLTRLLEGFGCRIEEIEPAEGPLRNFLYATWVGGRLLRFAKPRPIAPLVTAADEMSRRVLGHAIVNVAAVVARRGA